MALRDFFQKLRAESATPAATSGSDTVETVSSLVATMRSVFGDDREFERVLLTLDAQKSVTKQVLVDVFLKLFERTGGVPKKATRSEILRMILDERNIIIRNEKMGRMLGGRIVPAE
ncbi:MAG: hypothetical protein JNM47_14475 [Hyphomonadaceae bacterium]|nr:hypothetical protein [Hyphomonadaceae bacterium]